MGCTSFLFSKNSPTCKLYTLPYTRNRYMHRCTRFRAARLKGKLTTWLLFFVFAIPIKRKKKSHENDHEQVLWAPVVSATTEPSIKASLQFHDFHHNFPSYSSDLLTTNLTNKNGTPVRDRSSFSRQPHRRCAPRLLGPTSQCSQQPTDTRAVSKPTV